jgi:putative redox protein
VEQQIHFHNHLGEKLQGTLHRSATAAAFGVVLGHCFTCSRHTAVLRQIARDLEASGNMALRFDFSGNGQSEGIFAESTYSKQIAEMTAAAEFLRSEGVERIGLAGHSLGAVVALLAADQISSAFAVCTLAGRLAGLTPSHFLNRRQRAQVRETGKVSFASRGRSLELTEDFFSDAEAYHPAERVAALKKPLLVVHGEMDDIVPLAEAEHAGEINPAVEVAVIPGADHMFSQEDHRHQVSRLVVDWFVQKHPN